MSVARDLGASVAKMQLQTSVRLGVDITVTILSLVPSGRVEESP